MRFAPSQLLRQLWREQHPYAPEQFELPFAEYTDDQDLSIQ
jgi:hypothetical protein